MLNSLSDSMKSNRDELKNLTEGLNYLNNSHKNLVNSINRSIQTYDSYYENTNGMMDSLLRRTGNVRNSFRELNSLMEEQIRRVHSVDESMQKLSATYGAPKEEISKVIDVLKQYHEIQKEIEDSARKGYSSEYVDDLIDRAETFEKVLEKNKLSLRMLNDYKINGNFLKQHCDMQEELEDKINDVARAQVKANEEIDKGTKKWQNYKKSGWSSALSGMKGALGGVRSIFSALTSTIFRFLTAGWDKFLEVDQAGRDFGRHMGMSANDLERHVGVMYSKYADMALRLGMEFKDIYKFQVDYAEVTEKATILSFDQIQSMAALSRNVGAEAISNASKNLDVFTTSADATIEYLAKGTARAALQGLNVKKYSDAFANNIKMASKYTFKEGITGVQKMTLLSQRLKFNMESIGAAMDKFSTIEGAIEASAKIQVLGGAFATNFGNPLEVMSQAMLDAEGFTKRIIDTVASHAKFDNTTGEISLAPIDKQRLKAYAEALGMSFEEVHNMATQSRKSKIIEQQTNGRFSEEDYAFLSNKAQYNKERGYWEVIKADGSTSGDIRGLSKSQLKVLKNETEHEKMLNASVNAIKNMLPTKAEREKSHKEHIDSWKEFFSLKIAEKIQNLYGYIIENFPNWVNKIFYALIAVGGVALLGPLAGGLLNIGGGLLKAGAGLAKGAWQAGKWTARQASRGLSTAWKWGKGKFSGRAGGIRPTTAPSTSSATASRTVMGPRAYTPPSATSRYTYTPRVSAGGGGMWGKVGNFAGRAGGVLGVATAGYGLYSAAKNYSLDRDEIMSANISDEEKAGYLNQAKVARNEGFGGSVGGLAGGLAGAAMGTAILPGIGTLIGGFIGALGGYKAGKAVGNAVTETKEQTYKSITKNTASGSGGNQELTNIVRKIHTDVHEWYVKSTGKSTVKGGKEKKGPDIKLSDLNVKVGGTVKIVGDKRNNDIIMNDLLKNPSFRKGIGDIVRMHILETVGGKTRK